jgi:hypothetical protein
MEGFLTSENSKSAKGRSGFESFVLFTFFVVHPISEGLKVGGLKQGSALSL